LFFVSRAKNKTPEKRRLCQGVVGQFLARRLWPDAGGMVTVLEWRIAADGEREYRNGFMSGIK
jgi:hypothetical protein